MSTVMTQHEGALTFPRALVLASAGSGKTFRISSEIIALLARGEAPEEVFASTFTRKAAGEILDRVLVRLAAASLDDGAAAELAGHTGLPACDRAAWAAVLERTVRSLHRLNVGTLDAFFLRTAAVFANELGLPATWDIADDPSSARLRSLALQDVLRREDAGMLLGLVRDISRNTATRSLHDSLLRRLAALVAVHHALDPQRDDHWAGFDALAAGTDAAGLQGARLALAARVPGLPVPLTRAGTQRRTYARSLADMAAALQGGDWEAFVTCTLVQRARAGESYDSVVVPPEISDFVDQAWTVARAELAQRFARRSHALGRFAALFADALERRRAEHGAYGFDDITRLLGAPDATGTLAEIHYRLDAQVKHILLDEFQDTSVPQWTALEPIAGELLAGYLDERAAVIVADPKQSIYGWRGGTPDLVRLLRSDYALNQEGLAKSWRSSAVVLDFVNDLFGRLGDDAVWDDAQHTAVAQDWLLDFATHVPAKDLPGHVVVRVGPEDEEKGEARPRLAKRAAEEVKRLHDAMPDRSIGVLTRTNAAVARLMMYLKDLGVHASEEGGNPLTDAAPVTSVLALLRLCDNPGNGTARYHVARTPLGPALGYTDHTDDAATLALSSRTRAQLLEDGYGATITALAGMLEHACDARERRRLAQLAELAFRYDEQATLRPSDFVHFVRTERVEDPVAAQVRVMTVHQAKGLEFDVVVLPELDAPLVQRRWSEVMAYREAAGAPVRRAFPYVKKALRALFDLDELERADEQAFRNELRDGLSALYVGLTRARHALHILVKPRQGNGRTGARVLLRALAPEVTTFAEGDVVLERGDADWHRALAAAGDRVAGAEAGSAERAIVLRPMEGRTRALPRRSPSQLEGNGRVDLGMILRLSPAAARGSVAHRWFQAIGWLGDGVPSDDALRALAAEAGVHMEPAALDALAADFRGWLAAPAIAQLLSRSRWPAGASVETEVPFLARTGDVLMEGFIDRLVLTRTDGRVTGAAVIDFKTDAVSTAGEVRQRTSHYRPQVDAYRRAVCGMYGLAPEQVEGWLVFLEAGQVVRVDVQRQEAQ